LYAGAPQFFSNGSSGEIHRKEGDLLGLVNGYVQRILEIGGAIRVEVAIPAKATQLPWVAFCGRKP
jgi:hypothetical protein